MKNEPVSRRTRSKAPIKITSERDIRAQLRAEAAGRIDRSSNDAGGPAKRRKQGGKSSCKFMKAKGGKLCNRSSVTNLQDMPDDLITKIVDFVAASDGNYLYSAKEITENDVRLPFSRAYYEDGEIERIIELENTRWNLKKISSQPSVPVASLQGITLMLRSLSTVSKRINGFCTHFLKSVLVDADFFGVPRGRELGCILWMVRRQLSLSRVRAKSTDVFLLASVLIHSDTSELKACDVKLTGDSFIRTAWLARFHSEIVDLVAETTTLTSKSHNELLWDLGVKRTEYVHAKMTEEDFFNIIAAECSAIEVMSITMEFDPYSTRLESRYASIMSSTSLKYIDLNVCLAPRSHSRGDRNRDSPVILYSGLTKLIRLAPKLRGLRLGSTPYLNDKYGLQIDSESLELIDMIDVSKSTYVLRCKCPKLQNFMIRGYGYSTGLLPTGFDLSLSKEWWMPQWEHNPNSLPASHGFFGLEVPPDCTVHLKGYLRRDI
mmetsp:Transcript_5424/g.15341  ORF Transcript_5424/g.15341 Transcript_5424/m.15341 type:complete len:491 (-) Transcript_5424:7-1479(-)